MKFKNKYLDAVIENLDSWIVNVTDEDGDWYDDRMSEIHRTMIVAACNDLKNILIAHVELMGYYRQTFISDKNVEKSTVKLAINMVRQNFDITFKSEGYNINRIYKNEFNRLINMAFHAINEVDEL